MKHFCVFIDSRRGYARLGRCLQAVTQAATRIDSHIGVILIVDKTRKRLVSIAEQYGTRLMELPPGPRGQRYNTSVSATQADILIFIDPLTELPCGWLAQAEHALFAQHRDAVALVSEGWPTPAWLERFYRPTGRTLALCVKRKWFERVGGFDPELDISAERNLLARLMACHARVLHNSRSGDKLTN